VKYFKGDYKYILAETITYPTEIGSDGASLRFCTIYPDGLLTILPGYAWDGASGAIDTKTIRRGSLVHDALYQLLRETPFGFDGVYRRSVSDTLLREICLEDGMWGWRAAWVYRCVRLGGGPSARAKKRRVYTAP
jgi:hypothetical protein